MRKKQDQGAVDAAWDREIFPLQLSTLGLEPSLVHKKLTTLR